MAPAIGRHVRELATGIDPGVPDDRVGKALTADAKTGMASPEQLRTPDVTIDAVDRAIDHDFRAGLADDPVAVGCIPVLVTMESRERRLLDLSDAQAGMQRPGEGEGRCAVTDHSRVRTNPCFGR